MEIRPFTVAVADETLADLRQRLGRTRWPDEVANAGWDYGVPLAYMKDLVAYWRDGFDWRAQQARINGFAQFRAVVDGIGIHLIHERGKGPDPLPLILTHGWPSSFVEMLDLTRLLTDPGGHGADPADAFDVVVPSIPGYAFSDRPTVRGFDYRRIAALWLRLMAGLGYERFGAHAYDVGASIMGHLLLDHPDRLIGYHTTEPSNPAPYLGPGSPPPTEAERAYRALQARWEADEGGYMAIQTTRPQTLGYALEDSPAGLAAWIAEKWHGWTVPPGAAARSPFTMDQILTNVTIYWVTRTVTSANRLYYERAHNPRPRTADDRILVPTGVALTATQPSERPPREFVARLFADIRRWVELDRGGHFVAAEEPALLAEQIRAFFRDLR